MSIAQSSDMRKDDHEITGNIIGLGEQGAILSIAHLFPSSKNTLHELHEIVSS